MTGTLYNRYHPAPRGRVLTDALGKPFNCFYTEDKKAFSLIVSARGGGALLLTPDAPPLYTEWASPAPALKDLR